MIGLAFDQVMSMTILNAEPTNGTRHHSLLANVPIQKEENYLFNATLNTFYLWLYGIRHMVMDHSDSERKHEAAVTWATLSY